MYRKQSIFTGFSQWLTTNLISSIKCHGNVSNLIQFHHSPSLKHFIFHLTKELKIHVQIISGLRILIFKKQNCWKTSKVETYLISFHPQNAQFWSTCRTSVNVSPYVWEETGRIQEDDLCYLTPPSSSHHCHHQSSNNQSSNLQSFHIIVTSWVIYFQILK